MTVGSELRQARERAGLSAEQMSERTKIQLYKIEALEQDDFSRLPQGIYLDGIVRAYAHEVGTDPEPIVERVRVQRGKLPGDWEVPFAAPIELYPATSDRRDVPSLEDIPVLGESQGVDGLDAFSAESDLAAAPKLRAEHRILLDDHREHRNESRDLRDEYRGDEYVGADLPLSAPIPVPAPAPTRQRAGLALPLLILLAAAGLGIFFYQSAKSLDRDAAARVTESQPDNATDAARVETANAPSRKPEASDAPTPFSENVIIPETEPRPTATAGTSAVRRDTSGNSSTTSAAPPAAAPVRPVDSASAANTPRPQRPDRIDTPGTSPDVTGSWRLATQVESSSLSRFAGLKLGYEMQLEQDGDRVTGTGRKVTENGNGIGRRAQTPVTVSGTIDGDRLTLNFVERGARRATQGKFVLMVDDAGTLRGRFSSNAARSSGIVEAHRVQ